VGRIPCQENFVIPRNINDLRQIFYHSIDKRQQQQHPASAKNQQKYLKGGILSSMIRNRELNNLELVGQMLTVLMAGVCIFLYLFSWLYSIIKIVSADRQNKHEPTTAAITWACYHLSIQPEIKRNSTRRSAKQSLPQPPPHPGKLSKECPASVALVRKYCVYMLR
jgi:cytochrome P450